MKVEDEERFNRIANILYATRFSEEDQIEIDNTLEWITDFPDEAAMYIVYLEKSLNW